MALKRYPFMSTVEVTKIAKNLGKAKRQYNTEVKLQFTTRSDFSVETKDPYRQLKK